MTIRRIAPDEYAKTAWADGAEGGTAITAARLNNIEDAVEDVTNYAIDDDEDLSDAEQAIADNAAAIATLQDSVSQKAVGNFDAGAKAFLVCDEPRNRRVVFWDETGSLSYQKKVGNSWVTIWGK